jgi:6-phosphogluconolactonase
MIRVTRGLPTLMLALWATTPIVCAAQHPTKSGAVFVMTNAAQKNQILAFERSANGTLTSHHIVDTEGRGSSGVNDPLESQGSLTLSQDHSLLFAANAGSGTVSVFRVHGADLDLLDQVTSGGSQPVAIAELGSLVYVLNSGGAGSVVGFQVNAGGHMKQIANSTAFLSANATGGASIALSPDGKFLVITERLANTIDVFPVHPDGTLGPIVVNPSPGSGTFSAAFAPDGKAIVSETGPAGVTDGSAVSSYSILPNGALAAVSQSVPTFGAANCWNAVTPNGKFVYVSNAGTSTISGFAIGSNGVLTPIGSTVVGSNPAGSTNLDIAISADGLNLYTLNSGSGNVGVFAIHQDGTLTELGEDGEFSKFAGFNGIAAQ